MTITLHPGAVPLATLETIYWHGTPAKLDASFPTNAALVDRELANLLIFLKSPTIVGKAVLEAGDTLELLLAPAAEPEEGGGKDSA